MVRIQQLWPCITGRLAKICPAALRICPPALQLHDPALVPRLWSFSPSRVSKWVKHHQHLPLPSPLISPTNLKEQSQLATPIGEKFKIGREACKLMPYSPSGSTDNYHTKWGRSRIQARMPIRLLLTLSELIHMKNLTLLFKEILLFQKNYLQVLLWLPPDKPHLQLLLISIGSGGKQLWKMPQYMKSLRIGIWFEYTDQYHQV